MTENVVNPPINNDPKEKRNELFDHPSYIKEKHIFTSIKDHNSDYKRI